MKLYYTAVLFILFSSLSACTGNPPPAQAQGWAGDDPSCRVIGLQYICDRQCNDGEVGPNGGLCINTVTNAGEICDCGSRNKDAGA